ncbi:hypothetical protein [Rhizorhapis suberifaciens]|uniref:Putative ATP-dependent Lon-type protease n=1 Tax=Rhizorhapis suberifaciens TaxID=13656 RepID=A0A840HV17_9SPHN|nr:hypothetical protein [Rhizorhapis suberifaciens]MBB4641895.1 putative ATP-dependent Lon-type protease [Rhizorhapis suberifaciens]
MKKRQFRVIEYLEKLFPFDFFQIVFRFTEVDPEHSAFAAFGPHNGGSSAALFGPLADFFMIGGFHGLAHRNAPIIIAAS